MKETTKKLIEAVKADLVPSLGVTEPVAIAYAAAAAARALGGTVNSVSVWLNSGVYKNSFTCAVPGTGGVGCALAAALGAVSGDTERILAALENATPEDIETAKKLVKDGSAKAYLDGISPDISIRARVETDLGTAESLMKGSHTGLVSVRVNGREVFKREETREEEKQAFSVSSASFSDIVNCLYEAEEIDKLELAHGDDCIELDARKGLEKLDFLNEAVNTDMELFEEGKRSSLMPMTKARLGDDPEACSSARELAEMLTSGAIEARVRGAKAFAMAITGSGSHGVLCMLPIHAAAVYEGFDIKEERKALLLSALVTKYIKDLSGLLSTACGCVLAGGTGAALGLTYLYSLKDGLPKEAMTERLAAALSFMAASVTGMICHGGNPGCSLKASVGVNMAFSAAKMAVGGVPAETEHGVVGLTPEATILNMGLIARDMLPVEKTILDIMEEKSEKA